VIRIFSEQPNSRSYPMRSNASGKQGLKFVAVGILFSLALMSYWYFVQDGVAFMQPGKVERLMILFYIILSSSIFMVVHGLRKFYRQYIEETAEVRKIVRFLTVLYSIFYLYFSGIVAWQPKIDFTRVYGVTHATIIGFPASGSFGQYPSVNIFAPPSWHLGAEVLPLDLILMSVIIPMVALNFGIILTTLRRHRRMSNAPLNSTGVAATIFTSCPTCAVSAIAFGVSGIGAASWYATLASYQYLFVAIVVPLLLALPFINEPALKGVCKMTSLSDKGVKRPFLSPGYEDKKIRSGVSAKDYISLMKPGISFLLIVEAVSSYLIADSLAVGIVTLLSLIAAGFLSSGGSAAINNFLEKDRDSRMERTSRRPVASERISPGKALVFGILSISFSLAISAILINLFTAVMISFGAISYIFLYTLFLKPRTEMNIVIGGIAGVFPALAGWSAATGSIGPLAVLIGAIVFLWTPPHFWGLATKYRDDYRLAGYPMLPVSRDIKGTVRAITIWSVPMLVAPFVPLIIPQIGTLGIMYYGAAAVVTAIFVKIDVDMLREPTEKNAFRAFTFSIPYLFVILLAMIAGTITL